MTRYGGNPGRGSHALSLAAAEKIYDCRALAAEFFGVDDPARVFFTMNTTHGLNTVLKGLLHEGDHVLISDLEHNAVYRPLYKMDHTISYRRRGDFPTIGLVSLGGSVTGRTRANKFLVSDDLVKNAEVARSPERLAECKSFSVVFHNTFPF